MDEWEKKILNRNHEDNFIYPRTLSRTHTFPKILPKASPPPYNGCKTKKIWEQKEITTVTNGKEILSDNNSSQEPKCDFTKRTVIVGQRHGSIIDMNRNDEKEIILEELSEQNLQGLVKVPIIQSSAPLSMSTEKTSIDPDVIIVPSAGEESTDSDNDLEPTCNFQRKLSTHKALSRTTASLKEGYLMKQTSSFQRWHRRYFKVKGRTLYYGKHEKASIFDEISLTELTIAESSSKTFKHCFQVITPTRLLTLGTESRSTMEEWVQAIRAANNVSLYELGDHSTLLSGVHVWYATSHARPTYCNICREQLCGVTSQGLSCEICKFKAHKRCASKTLNNCKWTTLASMGKDIIEESDGTLSLPHQWLEGNLPVSAKCDVCERTCGSVLRLQDWRCLWCKACVHTSCRPIITQKCTVGRISIVPPTALHTIGSDDAWETSRSLQACSPLLVFVNSKSGDHQGLKFLRRFKQLLNPAQVFDLINGGPRLGLQLFRHFEPFRILVCGGDGSVGWVMSEIDRLDMRRQCQVGVLPLGTGNDLARVLGWGASCDDDAHLPHILEKYEKGTTKMLDRWSVMTFERGVILNPSLRQGLCLRETSNKPQIAQYEDSVVSHLQNILQSDQHQIVITSAKVLCETVRDMIGKIGASADSEIDEKCATLSQKLDSLLQTLHEETENTSIDEEFRDTCTVEEDSNTIGSSLVGIASLQDEHGNVASPIVKKLTRFRQRENLMSRANSLKKAVRQIIEHAEKTLDEQTCAPSIVRPVSLAVVAPTPQVVGDLSPSSSKHSLFSSDHDNAPALINLGSPIDPHITLPVPMQFADQNKSPQFRLRPIDHEVDGSESKVQRDHSQTEKDKESFPIKIEVESPSSSTRTPSEAELHSGFEKASLSPPSSSTFLTVPSPGTPTSIADISDSSSTQSTASVPTFSRSASPRASRRLSMGSLLKPLEVEIPRSPNSKLSFFDISESGLFLSSPSPSSPGKCTAGKRQKTLPIVNPLVSHPSWPAIAAGGIVSKVLLANADTICAVASPLMDPDQDDEDLMIGFDEKCVMNNYFGIGIDAKITLDFHMKREEHPEKCRSRTKNIMWYGVYGSKEYVQQTFKNLEQRVQLECDGRRLPLPSLQGIVILNIQSFMGGTNFWGGTKEDDCFLAPSFDDKILEVVAVFDSMQMAASRLINLQHHRIAQCHSIKITILGDEPIPIQVDGEAWLQPPGVIKIIHKNRMQMLCRNRALESSLKSWEEKQKQHMGLSPTSTETEDLDKKRHSKRLFSIGKVRDKVKDNKPIEDSTPDGLSEDAVSSDLKSIEKWTSSEIGEWLDHLQLGEYKLNFVRHDIQGSELLSLQRRDLKDLGITKVGHIKRILQGIVNLHKDIKKSYLREFCDGQSQNSFNVRMNHSTSHQYLPL